MHHNFFIGNIGDSSSHVFFDIIFFLGWVGGVCNTRQVNAVLNSLYIPGVYIPQIKIR